MASGTFSGVLGRHRRAAFVFGHLADVVVVAAVCVIVIALTRPAYVGGRLDLVGATSLLTLVAAAVGSAAAIVALVTGQLTGDPRPSWFGAALLLYGVVLLPMSALVVRDGGPPARLAVLSMLVIAFATLVAALDPPRALGSWGGWALLVLALGVGGLVALLDSSPLVTGLAAGPFTSIVVQTGWAGVALLFLLDGYRRQSRLRSRLGLGLVVVAVSQLYRSVVPSEPLSGLTYPSLRIAGMAVVLSALLTLALRTVSKLQDDYDVSQEKIGEATRLLEQATVLAAERDHELRNGLAGLAGAAAVLSHRGGGPDADRVREAVITELVRLRGMLEDPLQAGGDGGPPPGPDRVDGPWRSAHDANGDRGRCRSGWPPAGRGGAGTAAPGGTATAVASGHAVGPVLRQLAGLRPDRDITVGVEDGLPPVAAPEALTRQVVTNLLANCDRHAPGAPITVRAVADPARDAVRIEVRDRGPGLPGGAARLRIERGVHDESAGGSGLGLHISVREAQRHGGDLEVRTAHDPTGCVASLILPVAR